MCFKSGQLDSHKLNILDNSTTTTSITTTTTSTTTHPVRYHGGSGDSNTDFGAPAVTSVNSGIPSLTRKPSKRSSFSWGSSPKPTTAAGTTSNSTTNTTVINATTLLLLLLLLPLLLLLLLTLLL